MTANKKVNDFRVDLIEKYNKEMRNDAIASALYACLSLLGFSLFIRGYFEISLVNDNEFQKEWRKKAIIIASASFTMGVGGFIGFLKEELEYIHLMIRKKKLEDAQEFDDYLSETDSKESNSR